MRQRLVLRFDILYDERIRVKAIKAVESYEGVKSVVFDEDDETKMEVIGEDMDAYGLVNILKKRNYKAYMESLEEIKHDKKEEHHGKEKEKKHKKNKKKKNKGRKKKHDHSDPDSGSGSDSDSDSDSDSSSGSSSASESDSDIKKQGRRHNRSSSGSSLGPDSDKKQRHHRESRDRRTYIYRPEYPPRIYPTPAPYDNGYDYKYPNSRYSEDRNNDYKYPNSRYSEGYNIDQEGCSIM